MPHPTILLADDDEVFLDDASEFLSAHNYNVVRTRDPAEAKKWLLEIPIALAFLDIQFDQTDDRDEIGLTVARETIDLSPVPKIILTTHDQKTSYAVKSLRPRHDGKAPAVDFVAKRDGFDKLLEVIESNLNRPRIFLSYVREDLPAVNEIYKALSAVGFIPWIDEQGILGGANWKSAISNEIEKSDFFLVCISKKSFAQTGYFHKEIKQAFDLLDEMPDGQIYIVPVRLEDCAVTHPRIPDLQWVDLFDYPNSPASKLGFHRLVTTIRLEMRQRLQ